MSTDRRTFIKSLALYSSALAFPACKTVGRGTASGNSYLKVSPIDPQIPKRVSWDSLSAADKTAFIDAVKAMKGTEFQIPATFGSGGERKLDHWAAQAETHTWYCSHGTWTFLPWHRAYLYYFEQYLRKKIRDSFRLPYWDWMTNQEFPKELQDSALQTTLLISRSNNSIDRPGTAGDFQTKEWWQAAFVEIAKGADFDTIGGDSWSSGIIEGPYHNMVHVAVGGDMGMVSSAAKDPVFWLHHCNVDRLWSLWMDQIVNSGNIRRLFPSVDVGNWLNESFPNHFWSASGTLESATVKTSLFTEELGYNYDTMNKTWTITDIPSDQATAEVAAPVEKVETPAPSGLRLADTPGSVLALQFSIPARVFTSPQRLLSLRLKVLGIPQPKTGNLSYDVRLNFGNKFFALPEIAFFPSAHSAAHREGGVGLSLNKHMEAIRSLSDSSTSATLLLTLKDRQGRSVAIKDAAPDFTADPARFNLKLKAVFT